MATAVRSGFVSTPLLYDKSGWKEFLDLLKTFEKAGQAYMASYEDGCYWGTQPDHVLLSRQLISAMEKPDFKTIPLDQIPQFLQLVDQPSLFTGLMTGGHLNKVLVHTLAQADACQTATQEDLREIAQHSAVFGHRFLAETGRFPDLSHYLPIVEGVTSCTYSRRKFLEDRIQDLSLMEYEILIFDFARDIYGNFAKDEINLAEYWLCLKVFLQHPLFPSVSKKSIKYLAQECILDYRFYENRPSYEKKPLPLTGVIESVVSHPQFSPDSLELFTCLPYEIFLKVAIPSVITSSDIEKAILGDLLSREWSFDQFREAFSIVDQFTHLSMSAIGEIFERDCLHIYRQTRQEDKEISLRERNNRVRALLESLQDEKVSTLVFMTTSLWTQWWTAEQSREIEENGCSCTIL